MFLTLCSILKPAAEEVFCRRASSRLLRGDALRNEDIVFFAHGLRCFLKEEGLQPAVARREEDHHPHVHEKELFAKVVFFYGTAPWSPSSDEEPFHRRHRAQNGLGDHCEERAFFRSPWLEPEAEDRRPGDLTDLLFSGEVFRDEDLTPEEVTPHHRAEYQFCSKSTRGPVLRAYALVAGNHVGTRAVTGDRHSLRPEDRQNMSVSVSRGLGFRPSEVPQMSCKLNEINGAGNRVRTGDPQLGNAYELCGISKANPVTQVKSVLCVLDPSGPNCPKWPHSAPICQPAVSWRAFC